MSLMISNSSTKKLLYEVSIIRPLVIFLLVVLHSFEKISAGGGQYQDYQLLTSYQWFVWIVKGFRIETIALIAGYVFAYQSLVVGKRYDFWRFVKKKFFRLIIPMLFFGLIYYFCFYFDPSTFAIAPFLVSLLSGCGHLWFLPMLFWCFISIWTIDRYHLSSWLLLMLLALVSIMPTPGLPFGLGRLPHFLFFVYAGYFLWEKRNFVLRYKNQSVVMVILWITYLFLVIVKYALLPKTTAEMTIVEKGMILMSQGFVGLFVSCIGILALYISVCHFTERQGYSPRKWVINASDNCYGVYVFHQFILVWVYFYTPLVAVCPNVLVPWVGFVITMLTSLLLTKFTLNTKVGRFLIG